MTSAATLWRLQLVTVVACVIAVAAATAVAVTRIDFSTSFLTELADGCGHAPLAHVEAASMVILTLGGLGAASLCLGLRTVLRRVRATWRLKRALPLAGRLTGIRVGRILADDTAHAFCLGWLRPRIYVSRGVLDPMDRRSLGG